MAQTLLTINTTVPSEGPAVPVLSIFDNGDWEIAFAGDVDYIAENSPSFLGSSPVPDLLDELLLLYDESPLDVVGDRVTLFVSISVDAGGVTEPVILVWADGTTEIMDRANAEKLVEFDDSAHNFVSLVEMFDELRSFVTYHADDLLADDGEEFDYDEEGLDD